MNVSICNFSEISDEEVERVCAAINRKLASATHWNLESRVRLQGRDPRTTPHHPDGDALLYVWGRVADVPKALADENPRDGGLPFGFVVLEISEQLLEPWSVTLSREVLALIGDSNLDRLSSGRWREMCDAIETEMYEIEDDLDRSRT